MPLPYCFLIKAKGTCPGLKPGFLACFLAFSKAFEKEFDTRIHWEILSEFGYNASIGRTLEKTGSSAVSFNKSLFATTYDQIKDWLGKNNLETIEKEQFINFLNGYIYDENHGPILY